MCKVIPEGMTYDGWDPILGTRYNLTVVVPTYPAQKFHKKEPPNQRRVQSWNQSKRSFFTRAIGYA